MFLFLIYVFVWGGQLRYYYWNEQRKPFFVKKRREQSLSSRRSVKLVKNFFMFEFSLNLKQELYFRCYLECNTMFVILETGVGARCLSGEKESRKLKWSASWKGTLKVFVFRSRRKKNIQFLFQKMWRFYAVPLTEVIDVLSYINIFTYHIFSILSFLSTLYEATI